ncbi:haloalkane dehalogenase [Agromyces sp. CFH 90414]|uniref:Haloalkane dehalogenase n=1 Tax=Agromyces agglutinans TaxID=2662258 RepID=A0A6I2F7F5_9MICO|nr:haloalkane dehalogenase [Agromyces agglutinans]MRG60241.1 haloalkane dehalogenase [Agromyces agglutinans]
MPAIPVLDSTMHFDERGRRRDGTTFVFLHGNPGSSHQWRHVLDRFGDGHLLAPDLIGMGRSGKPDLAYAFADHARYLDAWFDAVGIERVVLVGHDWGGALAFDWAARHPDRVLGVAFFESIVKPMQWGDLAPQARARSEAVRTPGLGEERVLATDAFIRQAFTGGVLTPVEGAELDAYLAPFPTPESRRPVLAWARQLPLGGEPRELVERIEAYDRWLATSDSVPKLLLTFSGSPTLLIDDAMAAWCAASIAALEVVDGGLAGHHAQEDRPQAIADEIARWAERHGLQ